MREVLNGGEVLEGVLIMEVQSKHRQQRCAGNWRSTLEEKVDRRRTVITIYILL